MYNSFSQKDASNSACMDQTIGRLNFVLLTMLFGQEVSTVDSGATACTAATAHLHRQISWLWLLACLQLGTHKLCTTERVLLHLRHLQMGGRSQKHPCSEHSETDSPAQVARVLVAQLNRTTSPTFCLWGSCCVHHKWINNRKVQMRPLVVTSAISVNFCSG
jgi:hypothetical protein